MLKGPMKNIYIQQFSSELSEQSFMKSHSWLIEMHRPSPHLKLYEQNKTLSHLNILAKPIYQRLMLQRFRKSEIFEQNRGSYTNSYVIFAFIKHLEEKKKNARLSNSDISTSTKKYPYFN